MREILSEYADIKNKIKELEQKAEELSTTIQAQMVENGVDKVDAEGLGTFTVAKRKAWKYSEDVVRLAEDLANQKKTEQADGTATFEEDPYLVFKPLKTE